MQTPAELIHFFRNMKSFIKGGENVDITGEGTEQFPLIISSTGGGGGESLIKQVKVTVTPEQMLDLVDNPVELIPAQGANTCIIMIGGSMFLDFNSVAYDFGSFQNVPILSINGNVVSSLDSNTLNSSVNAVGRMIISSLVSSTNIGFNNPLLLQAPVSATQGDSPVTFIIDYIVHDYS